jgi:hypothetical protein
MHVIVLILWVVSLVLFAYGPATTRPITVAPWGLFFFDLWLGLQFLIEASDRVTLSL